MKDIVVDSNNIAYCGLYCGGCRKFLTEKCPGCQENEKASWCQVRTCCGDNNFQSCADCTFFDDPYDCKKLNNFMSKIFSVIFRSDRKSCLTCIKNEGYEKYAEIMTQKKRMSLAKGRLKN
jgi:hypothetical protein